MPRFTELIDKIGRNEQLTAGELGDLRRQGEAIDEVVSLVKSWITTGTSAPFIQNLRAENIFVPSGEIRLGTPAPGQGFSGVRIAQPPVEYSGEEWNIVGINDDELQVGIRASDGRFLAAGGNLQISESGMALLEGDSGQSFIAFYDETGATQRFKIVQADSSFNIQSSITGGEIGFFLVLTDASTPYLILLEDNDQDNRVKLELQPGVQGSRFTMIGAGGDSLLDFRTEGSSGGSTFIRMRETTTTPPEGEDDAVHIYMKGDKLIFQYNDAGTVRYKYLGLTGTGTTWTHTTSAP